MRAWTGAIVQFRRKALSCGSRWMCTSDAVYPEFAQYRKVARANRNQWSADTKLCMSKYGKTSDNRTIPCGSHCTCGISYATAGNDNGKCLSIIKTWRSLVSLLLLQVSSITRTITVETCVKVEATEPQVSRLLVWFTLAKPQKFGMVYVTHIVVLSSSTITVDCR